jgi:hypothetical protein
MQIINDIFDYSGKQSHVCHTFEVVNLPVEAEAESSIKETNKEC